MLTEVSSQETLKWIILMAKVERLSEMVVVMMVNSTMDYSMARVNTANLNSKQSTKVCGKKTK